MLRGGRTLLAVLLTAILAVRLLTPAGFMPSFEGGAVSIVVCPDEAPLPTMSHHHHGGTSKKLSQPCPFAASAGMGALAADFVPLLGVLVLAVALLLGRTFLFVERHRVREWPPSQGPPLHA
jgi:hypothetical protein